MTGALSLALGALLLVVGAELFAENVASAARRLGLTALALGVLLAGAEPEEALTAGIASGRGHPQLAVGDAVGANFVILTLALGLAGVLTPLPVGRRVREYVGAACLAGLAALGCLLDGRVGRVEAFLLVMAYVVVVAWVWRRERRPPAIGEVAELDEQHEATGRTGVAVGLMVAGVLLMVAGGWLAVIGAEHLVTILGLDDTGVGLTVLALATSAEMLALVVAAARHRVAEVAVAGLIGAVAYNATVSLGVGAMVSPLEGVGNTRLMLVALAGTALPLTLFVLGRSARASRWGGLVLVTTYLVAVLLLLT